MFICAWAVRLIANLSITFESGKTSFIVLTCPCNLEHFTYHFYLVKLGCTGTYIIFFLFFFFFPKRRLWVLNEAALTCTHNLFLEQKKNVYIPVNPSLTIIEPRSEKTGLRGFRPGPTQTGVCSHRRWLET